MALGFHGMLRLKWILLAIAFVFWIGGFTSLWFGESLLGTRAVTTWTQDVFFVYRGLPLLFALCVSEDADESPAFYGLTPLNLF